MYIYQLYGVAQKYPTAQNAISQQPSEIFIPKSAYLYGKYHDTIMLFYNYFSFRQRSLPYK